MLDLISLALLAATPWFFLTAQKNPERLLLMWLFLSPFSSAPYTVFDVDLRVISLDRVIFFSALFRMLTRGGIKSQLFPTKAGGFEKAAIAFIVIYLLKAVIEWPLGTAQNLWMVGLDKYIVPFFAFLYVRHLLVKKGQYNEQLENRIARVLILTGLICAAMSIFEGVTLIDLLAYRPNGLRAEGGSPRTNGPFAVPGELGLYLVFVFLFAGYRWTSNQRETAKGKLRRLFYQLVLVVGVFFNMFRNVWVALLGGSLIRCFFSRGGRLGFAIAAPLVVFVGFLSWSSIEETDVYQERIINSDNIDSRLGAWLYAFRAFSEHPITGLGYRVRKYIYTAQERGDDLRWNEDVKATFHPHNSFVALLAEHGLLLGIPFGMMVVCWLIMIKRCFRAHRGPKDKAFGVFAVSITFAIFFPNMTDRCINWDKYNFIVMVFFAMIVARTTCAEVRWKERQRESNRWDEVEPDIAEIPSIGVKSI